MTALIIKVNSPNVRIFRGSVRNTRTGFIKVLITPSITAAKSAVLKSATRNPGTIEAVASKATAFRSNAIINFIKENHPLVLVSRVKSLESRGVEFATMVNRWNLSIKS